MLKLAVAALLLFGTSSAVLAGGGCPEGYTPIDGICRPYRGPHIPYGYYGGYPRADYGYDYPPPNYGYRYRRYDPGAAAALGIIGATAGAMIHQNYRRHGKYRRYRR